MSYYLSPQRFTKFNSTPNYVQHKLLSTKNHNSNFTKSAYLLKRKQFSRFSGGPFQLRPRAYIQTIYRERSLQLQHYCAVKFNKTQVRALFSAAMEEVSRIHIENTPVLCTCLLHVTIRHSNIDKAKMTSSREANPEKPP